MRGVGLLVGVELRNEGYGGTIIPELLKRGVTAAWTLNQQRVIRLEPPLIVTARANRNGAAGVRRGGGGSARPSRSSCVPYVATSIVIDAPAAVIYELAKDQERFPQFMPDVESVTVVERRADSVLTRWKTLIEDAPIEWLEEDRFDDAALRIDYKLLEGDLDTFEGSWTFEAAPGGTLVALDVDLRFRRADAGRADRPDPREEGARERRHDAGGTESGG